jgi:hypothetical protein
MGCVVTFTPRPLNPLRKIPKCPLNRRLGGSKGRSGPFGEDINFLPLLSGIEHEYSEAQPVKASLYRLRNPDPCSLSSISTILKVGIGITMNEAVLFVGMRYVAYCGSSYTSERDWRCHANNCDQ